MARTLTHEEREEIFCCKVCHAVPNEEGEVRHGRGCYVLDEDGGGYEWVDLPEPPEDTPEEQQACFAITITIDTRSVVGSSIG